MVRQEKMENTILHIKNLVLSFQTMHMLLFMSLSQR